MKSSEPSSLRNRQLRHALGVMLAVLILVVYWPCFHYPFTDFDDQAYVTANPHVLEGLTADGVRYAFTTGDCGNWHPLTWLTLQLDRTLYGDNAGGFHATNVLLHLASTLVLFVVLCRMTEQVWRSASVAALFALHPLNVEPVAWVAERKGTLSTLFWMLSLAAYLGYVRRPSVGRYLLIVLALLLGLMAKPVLVTLPFALLLLDYWPLDRWRSGWPWRRLVLEKVPLFVLVLGWCGIAFWTQEQIGALPSLATYPLDVRILNALLSYVAYLGKLFGPIYLAAHYPHPGAAVSGGAALAAGLLLVLITLLMLGPGRRRPYLAVGWLWYLGTLVPMIGLVQIGDHGMADRYAYVPMIGLFLLLTWGLADLLASAQLPQLYRVTVAGVVLTFCAVLSWFQVGYWKDDQQLWEHALEVTTNNALAHNNLALHFIRRGRLLRAEKEVEAAVAIRPDSPLFQHNRAIVLRELGRREEALTACRQASALDPEDAQIHLTLANLLRDLGRGDEALPEFRAAVALAPDKAIMHGNLANQLLDFGQLPEAMSAYRRAIELDPAYASPHVGLGSALAELGKREEASAEFHQAIQLDPKNAVAHYNLALNEQAEGRLEEAMNEYRKALQLGYRQAEPQLQACEQLRQLRPRLPDLLAGRDKPADNAERLSFADLCAQPFEARYAKAAQLYREAFAADPALADDPRTSYRSLAALAAARAGCGQGRETPDLTEAVKTRLRRQALEWLQAELAYWQQGKDKTEGRILIVPTLRAWQKNDGLAGVREPAALAGLPQEERTAWQKFWHEVETLVGGHDR
jgi:protein O-mannosyl-transferase